MKIYRQSLSSSFATRHFATAVIICIVTTLIFWNSPFFFNILWIESGVLLFAGVAAVSQLFYVIFTGHKLAIKNPIYRCGGATYLIQDIQYIEIGCLGGLSRPFIRITTPTGTSCRYVIDLVPETHYAALIRDLQAVGIEVKTFGIDKSLDQDKS